MWLALLGRNPHLRVNRFPLQVRCIILKEPIETHRALPTRCLNFYFVGLAQFPHFKSAVQTKSIAETLLK